MKVLLIDDSTLSRTILKRSMGSEHLFIEAENGMRGLELFFIERPDLVFLDLTMPGMNGLEILEKLHEIDANAKVIIGSADIQEFTRRRAEELGASAYLNKPFTPEGVQDAIRRVMGESPTGEN